MLSFGTKGIFEGYINQLRESLDRYDIPHELEVVPPQTKKYEAALGKPQFILDRLNEPVLWLDADSLVLGPISLPNGEWDCGFLNHWGAKRNKVTCCALAFQPTDRARDFLERWAETCGKHSRGFNGSEHDRMLAIKANVEMNEIELTECLTGRLVVNYRIRKEHYV